MKAFGVPIGLVVCLMATCVSEDAKPKEVRIYRSDRVLGDVTHPDNKSPHYSRSVETAVIQIDQDDKVSLALFSHGGKISVVRFEGQMSWTQGSYVPFAVLHRVDAAVYTGSDAGAVFQLHTAMIQFEGEHPARVNVFTDFVADFEVSESLKAWDMEDEPTREIAEWFKGFDEQGTKRQRTIISF